MNDAVGVWTERVEDEKERALIRATRDELARCARLEVCAMLAGSSDEFETPPQIRFFLSSSFFLASPGILLILHIISPGAGS